MIVALRPCLTFGSAMLFSLLAAAQTAMPAEKAVGLNAPATSYEAVFATVDGQPLLRRDLHAKYSSILRSRFYHGQVPEGQTEVVMKEAQDDVIDAFLLSREVTRRQVPFDEAKVAAEIAAYDARYQGSPQWGQMRDTVLPGLRTELERQNRLVQLERQIKAVPPPPNDAVMDFYKSKPELFTEPEKLRLRVIILGVDPSSPEAKWQATRAEAAKIVAQIRAGADFAELAKLHSDDESGKQGGDMGYLHQGMMPDNLQVKIDGIEVGTVSDPMEVLQGIAIVRVEDRKVASLQSYESVQERARGLLLRELEEAAWTSFRTKLRSSSEIRLLPSAGR